MRKFLVLFIIILLSNISTYGQAEFFQSFIEYNISGSSRFGNSVSSAGDVNNDGFDDFIIGAPRYSKAYIFYGGNEVNTYPDVILSQDENDNYFGYSVSSAGDVNNDGYDDVIVGDYISFLAYIYYGGEQMDSSPDVILNGYDLDAFYFGITVSTAGDINNDGYSDVIVGSEGNSHAGAVYIYLGGETMDDSCDVILLGENRDDNFGCSISTAGDINNDGYDDVIIGALGYNSNRGKVYVYLGSKEVDNISDIKIYGSDNERVLGRSVSTAGDVNNDGYDDFIIGLRVNGYVGEAHLYYGSESINDSPDVVFKGEGGNSEFASSVSTTGDINNDGYDDFIIGASEFESAKGRAYIYLGENTVDTNPDLIITGEEMQDRLSSSVSSAGDVDNDGFDDFIIGIPGYMDDKGKANIYYGSSSIDNLVNDSMVGNGKNNKFGYSISNAGDVNNDGYDDIVVGAIGYESSKGRAYIYFGGNNMNNTADVVFTGERPNDDFGSSVLSAGDVNNDGFDDIIVCASGYYKGKVYLYYGGANMDNIADVVFNGETDFDRFGSSASGIGDINSDGYDDFIIAAKEYHGNIGRAYIYYGGSVVDSVADVILTGSADNDKFSSIVSSAGDVNADGFDDFIITDRSQVYLYFGEDYFNSNNYIVLTSDGSQSITSFSVSSAGDINNDGYDDILVGSGDTNNDRVVYIYLGSNHMDNVSDFVLTNSIQFSNFGNSVSSGGDINNDSYDDIIVGSDGYSSYTGGCYVYYGGDEIINSPNLFLTGENRDDRFGFSVFSAGDVNRDGYDDILVSSFEYPENGKVYTFLGKDIVTMLPPSPFSPDNGVENISKSVDLVWNKSIDVDYFQIEIALDNEFSQRYLSQEILFPDNSFTFNSFNGLTTYYWRVRGFKNLVFSKWSETISFTTLEGSKPHELKLEQNYPNPFRQTTTIEYGIPEPSNVNIYVYNILGQNLGVLLNEGKDAGYHKFVWNAINLPSGVYIIRVKAEGLFSKNSFTQVKKALLLK
ncbi:MAG: FG-GAP repeat protein [Bacteroidetes bacterium]|nr:FG-GAP repeat protein [Bacteroidota bacterium]MBU1116321.1 FG-GAP repeat protein [Bacteroidota bacterium]MBU1796991.1 FG-GAP repeat protein [Bacteroidota bacterium]